MSAVLVNASSLTAFQHAQLADEDLRRTGGLVPLRGEERCTASGGEVAGGGRMRLRVHRATSSSLIVPAPSSPLASPRRRGALAADGPVQVLLCECEKAVGEPGGLTCTKEGFFISNFELQGTWVRAAHESQRVHESPLPLSPARDIFAHSAVLHPLLPRVQMGGGGLVPLSHAVCCRPCLPDALPSQLRDAALALPPRHEPAPAQPSSSKGWRAAAAALLAWLRSPGHHAAGKADHRRLQEAQELARPPQEPAGGQSAAAAAAAAAAAGAPRVGLDPDPPSDLKPLALVSFGCHPSSGHAYNALACEAQGASFVTGFSRASAVSAYYPDVYYPLGEGVLYRVPRRASVGRKGQRSACLRTVTERVRRRAACCAESACASVCTRTAWGVPRRRPGRVLHARAAAAQRARVAARALQLPPLVHQGVRRARHAPAALGLHRVEVRTFGSLPPGAPPVPCTQGVEPADAWAPVGAVSACSMRGGFALTAGLRPVHACAQGDAQLGLPPRGAAPVLQPVPGRVAALRVVRGAAHVQRRRALRAGARDQPPSQSCSVRVCSPRPHHVIC